MTVYADPSPRDLDRTINGVYWTHHAAYDDSSDAFDDSSDAPDSASRGTPDAAYDDSDSASKALDGTLNSAFKAPYDDSKSTSDTASKAPDVFISWRYGVSLEIGRGARWRFLWLQVGEGVQMCSVSFHSHNT